MNEVKNEGGVCVWGGGRGDTGEYLEIEIYTLNQLIRIKVKTVTGTNIRLL